MCCSFVHVFVITVKRINVAFFTLLFIIQLGKFDVKYPILGAAGYICDVDICVFVCV